MRKENIRIYYQNYPRCFYTSWEFQFDNKKTRIVSMWHQMKECPSCIKWWKPEKDENCDYCNGLGFVNRKNTMIMNLMRMNSRGRKEQL